MRGFQPILKYEKSFQHGDGKTAAKMQTLDSHYTLLPPVLGPLTLFMAPTWPI